MISEGALRAAQARAERFLTDTVTVSYDTGATSTDPTTGSETAVLAERFVSKCKIQTRNLDARQSEVGGRTATTVSVELHLPIDSPAVEVGDICEITAVGALSDVQLLGRTFRVIAPVAKSFATARRLDVEEVVA